MNLYKNGFVVAEIAVEGFAYRAWPLANLRNDRIAETLTNEADETWFAKFNMQHIAPDLNYTKTYLEYCNTLDLQAVALLFESPDDSVVIDDELIIHEVLGFDCIGTVYYSYLQGGLDDFKQELLENSIIPNKFGLFDRLEDALFFIELRRKALDLGVNLEDFWTEIPVRISIANIG
jgi:hypothetical protein